MKIKKTESLSRLTKVFNTEDDQLINNLELILKDLDINLYQSGYFCEIFNELIINEIVKQLMYLYSNKYSRNKIDFIYKEIESCVKFLEII